MSKAQNRIKPDIYTEQHHIKPKSIGGEDTPDNLVDLTAREHFIAHKLWLKFENNPEFKRKAQNAFWCMATMRSKDNAGRIIPNNRDYALAKNSMIEAKLGKSRSDTTKKKISESLTSHFNIHGSHNKGRSYSHLSQEERNKLFGDKNRGRIQTLEEKENRAAKLRKPRSAQARENIRLGALKREAARRQKIQD